MRILFTVLLIGFILIGLFSMKFFTTRAIDFLPSIQTLDDVRQLFPASVQDVEKRTEQVIQDTHKKLAEFLKIPAQKRAFVNTVAAFDHLAAPLHILAHIWYTVQLTHPDAALRTTAAQAYERLVQFSIEHLSNNVEIYKAFKDYAQHKAPHEDLNAEERYYLHEMLKGFEKAGLNLPEAQLVQVKKIKNELVILANQFEKNISEDVRTISVQEKELAGVNPEVIASLSRDEKGLVIVPINYPMRDQILETCAIEDTRRAFWHAFNNRGYPKNEAILKQIIALRDELAQLLGYTSYADLDIDDQMANSVTTVDGFLADLLMHSKKAGEKEREALKNNLPEGVSLTENGAFKPWDILFIQDAYKKKHYTLDEQALSAYFPLEHTISALFSIYEKFLNLSFTTVPAKGFWHEEVQALEVRDAHSKKFIGYILLDLFPRPNKYTHACQITIVPTIKQADWQTPAVAVVLANFPRSMAGKPALLKRNDVRTFFHEFGHALHALLGPTQLVGFSGTNVKSDFVELPSQMLEEWLTDREILKMVSWHIETGQPLSDEMISKIIAAKNFMVATQEIERQAYLAKFSLECFKKGAQKEPHMLAKHLYQEILPYLAWQDDNHFEAAFGHLATDGYGAKYYGYLWSRVYALDLFEHIKKYGLLNPEIGMHYRNKILGKGGSVDPMQLLIDFLGRTPNSQAFFASLGLA